MSNLPQRVAGVRQGIMLTLAPILAVMGFVLVAPILGTMQQHFQSVPNAEFWVPMIMTAPALCIALLSPLAGVLADQYGLRKILLMALVIYTIFGTAPLYLDSLWAIVATRIGVGVAEAAILTCTTALVAAYYQGDERRKWLAYQAGAAPAAATLLLVLGGLIGSGGWRLPFAGYALSALVLLGIAVYIWEPLPAVQERVAPAPLPWPHLLKVGVFALFASFMFYIVPAELAFILGRLGFGSPSTIGYVIAVGTLFVPAGTLSSRPLSRFPVGQVLSGAVFFMGVGLGLIGVAHSLPVVVAGVIVHQFAGGVMLPTAMNYAINGLSKSQQGRGLGLWWSIYFIAQFLTPISVTLMSKATGGLASALLVYGGLGVAFCIPIMMFASNSQQPAQG
jgi:MFS family permease